MTMRGGSKLARGVLTAALVGALAGGAVAAPRPKICLLYTSPSPRD